jgi:ribosomal protein L34E
MTYRLPNSRKSDFATEPTIVVIQTLSITALDALGTYEVEDDQLGDTSDERPFHRVVCARCGTDVPETSPLRPDQAAQARQQAQRSYRTTGLGTCPTCQSDQIEGGPLDMIERGAYQEMTCQDCEANWTDVYHLAGSLRPATVLQDIEDINNSLP